MVFFEKSQPAPDCLEIEKNKKSGDYKCGNVLETLKNDFKNKCYICEDKAPTTINVEHFVPHKGNKNLEFEWNNLFWACGHCNNTKLDNYTPILNCTDKNEEIETKIKYIFSPFPAEEPQFVALDNSQKTLLTRNLLNAVYNGTTLLKNIEASNLRDKLLDEIMNFQKSLLKYHKSGDLQDIKQDALTEIRLHLSKQSAFTAFKRQIILNNDMLKRLFFQYFD